MRRFLLPMCAAAAVALLLQDPATGRRRRPGTPQVARTYLRYTWQERVDDLVIGHELHLYGNGFVRYAQRAGVSEPVAECASCGALIGRRSRRGS